MVLSLIILSNKKLNRLVIASRNRGKIAELQDLLQPYYRISHLAEYSDMDVVETGATFIENAIIKARACSKETNLSSVADDSGICVPALNGAPGLYSAQYSELDNSYQCDRQKSVDVNNNQKLLQQLQSKTDRRAFYYCCLVLLQQAKDPAPLIAIGRWWGSIAEKPSGINGFGYDSIFIPKDAQNTVAQLQPCQKKLVSHRAKAIQNLLVQLRA